MKSRIDSCIAATALVAGVFCLGSAVRAETIGSPLQQRTFKDGNAGQVYVYAGTSSPFALDGVASSWSFYDANTSGGVMTPLLLKRVASNRYQVTGIGTSRTSTAAGVQTYAFDLIAGSDAVTAGSYTFGFTNRAYAANGSGGVAPGSSSGGVVSYDHPGVNVPTDDWRWTANLTTGGPVSLTLGSVFGTGGTAFHDSPAGGRVYSANFTTTVPEPASIASLAMGCVAMAVRRRRRGASARLA